MMGQKRHRSTPMQNSTAATDAMTDLFHSLCNKQVIKKKIQEHSSINLTTFCKHFSSLLLHLKQNLTYSLTRSTGYIQDSVRQEGENLIMGAVSITAIILTLLRQ